MDWQARIAEFERLNPQDESGRIVAPPPQLDETMPPWVFALLFILVGGMFSPGVMLLGLVVLALIWRR
jgi:hypothetical protein